jgi:hypothetical protein
MLEQVEAMKLPFDKRCAKVQGGRQGPFARLAAKQQKEKEKEQKKKKTECGDDGDQADKVDKGELKDDPVVSAVVALLPSARQSVGAVGKQRQEEEGGKKFAKKQRVGEDQTSPKLDQTSPKLDQNLKSAPAVLPRQLRSSPAKSATNKQDNQTGSVPNSPVMKTESPKVPKRSPRLKQLQAEEVDSKANPFKESPLREKRVRKPTMKMGMIDDQVQDSKKKQKSVNQVVVGKGAVRHQTLSVKAKMVGMPHTCCVLLVSLVCLL